MRELFVVAIGLCLGACATSGAMSSSQTTPVAAATPAEPADAASCSRSFVAEPTCPVLGTLTDTDRQELATFMQENRPAQDTTESVQTPAQPNAAQTMQAADDN